jgi:hypothetical protein
MKANRFQTVLLVAWLLAACLWVLGQSLRAADDPAYEFTLNGKPFVPTVVSLHGNDTTPEPGDLICLDYRFLLTLGAERACHFETTPQDDGRVLLRLPDGQTRVIGALVTWTYQEDARVVFNPLAKLSPDEIHGLWGVYLDDWSDELGKKLAEIDPGRTCVTLGSGAAEDGERDGKRWGKLPPLPEGIRYLNVCEDTNMGIHGYESLARLTQLRFLAVRALTAPSFNCELIARNERLCRLKIATQQMTHPEALARLTSVERLSLAFIPNLKTIGFAAAMPHLRWLSVAGTAVHDLSPLGTLPELEEVHASRAALDRLPGPPMPSLRRLEILSTPLSDEAVDAFCQTNPKCAVYHRWNESLQQVVASANRVRIRSGGTCHRNPDQEKTQFELNDAAAAQEFARRIEINEAESGFECQCCGEPTFEFYEGDRLLAMLGFHHGRSLRWPEIWPGDALLMSECAAQLPDWWAARGYDGFVKEREEAQKEEAREEERKTLFRSFFPAHVRQFIDSGKARRLVTGMHDPLGAITASCRALGALDGRWSELDSDKQVAIDVAKILPPEEFLKALHNLRGDGQAELGAARLGVAEDLLARLPAGERMPWRLELTKATLKHTAVLENKLIAVRRLAACKDEDAKEVLLQIARGEIGSEENGWGVDEQEPGLRGIAYLGLAAMKDATIEEEVKGHLAKVDGPNRAAVEICLALLGDPQYIKVEHFRFQSYTLGESALAAIEQFQGREGMEVLVLAGLEHPWANVRDDATKVFQRTTGQSWKDAPTRGRVESNIKAWWKEHGEEFVKERRAAEKK